jgi:hypothetical protein
VKEAFRLVKNSIVHVEAPDTDLADDEIFEDADVMGELGEGLAFANAAEDAEAAPMDTNAAEGEQAVPSPAENGEAAAAPAAVAPATQPQTTRVSQAKLNNVKNLLVMRLRQLDTAGAEGEGQAVAVGPDGEAVGAQQKDLLRWYFDYLVQRGAITTREQGVEEIVLAEKIVGHLVRREAVLLVVDQPERRERESGIDYTKRVQMERVLALNPNYSID